MTTNRILVLNAIQAHPGLTDGELRNLTGVEPHQQVNQICRSLAAAGLTRRIPGADGRVINLPVGTKARRVSKGRPGRRWPCHPGLSTRRERVGLSWSSPVPPTRHTAVFSLPRPVDRGSWTCCPTRSPKG